MKTKLVPLAALALLLLSACAGQQISPQNRALPPESPGGEYIARTAAAELHIVSPGGRISIGKLEIDNGKPPLVAQTASPAPAQCPFPAAPATPPPAGDREAGHEADAGDLADGGVVNKPEERTDAVPPRPKLLRLQ